MRGTLIKAAMVIGLLGAWQVPALAQTGATPQQIQGLIAQGQENAALSDLQMTLQSHPQSGVAWYLTAEAQDARGDEGAARDALAKADQYAPGLPFAQPNDVAALRAHLAGGGSAPAQAGYAPPARHFSPFVAIGAIVVLFLLFRMFVRSRRRMMPGYPMNPNYSGGNPVGPYGPGGMPYGGGGMMGGGMGGGGIGGSILGGLAAGAGFAGGERIIDGMMGGNQGGVQNNDPNGTIDPGVPARDDGLQGSPGWGDNSGGIDNSGTIDSGGDSGGFDPGNNW